MSFDLLKTEIIDKNLCEGCGLCAGFCKAITLENGTPNLTGRCMLRRGSKNCGLCYELCPQAHPAVVSTQDFSPLGIASVQAKDEKILEIASNGGFVTTLLRYLIQKKKIMAAVAVTGEKRSPVGLKVTSVKDVKKLAGTRYSPSGVLNEFAEALRTHGRDIAVVGLPCELRGVKRVEDHLGLNVLKIGLFCSNNNRMNEEGKIEKLGSCEHCTDFFALNADLSCGFAGSEKGYTTVIATTERGKELLEKTLDANLFKSKEPDMTKVKAAQTRKSKREIAVPAPTLREKVLEGLSSDPLEMNDLASKIGVKPDDIIYHLLILQHMGKVSSSQTDPYSLAWRLA